MTFAPPATSPSETSRSARDHRRRLPRSKPGAAGGAMRWPLALLALAPMPAQALPENSGAWSCRFTEMNLCVAGVACPSFSAPLRITLWPRGRETMVITCPRGDDDCDYVFDAEASVSGDVLLVEIRRAGTFARLSSVPDADPEALPVANITYVTSRDRQVLVAQGRCGYAPPPIVRRPQPPR